MILPSGIALSSAPPRAVSSATGSFSVAVTRPAPSCTASSAMIPLPVPTSSTSAPGRSARSSSTRSRHSAVVGWLPVPNAIPGSMTTRTSPRRAGASSQGGCTHERGPTRSGRCCFRHATLQSSSASSTGASARPNSAAERNASSRSAKCAMHRPASGGKAGVPGIRGCPGSCSSDPFAPTALGTPGEVILRSSCESEFSRPKNETFV